MGDFAHQFGVQHFVVFIQYDYGTCGEAAQGAAFDGYAVVAGKVAAEGGEGDDVVQTFCAAEACLGERQVGGNAQDDGVFQRGGAFVMWGGVYFCTEWVEEKKRRKSLWGVGLSKAGAGKNLHQLLLWFDKKCVIFCTEMYGK